MEIALFPYFYGNCITTTAPLIYEKSLLSVWKGQRVEYVKCYVVQGVPKEKIHMEMVLYCFRTTVIFQMKHTAVLWHKA